MIGTSPGKGLTRWVRDALGFDAEPEPESRGVGPVQLDSLLYTARSTAGKMTLMRQLAAVERAAGHQVWWMEPGRGAHAFEPWRFDYELSAIERALSDFETLRRARDAAVADPAATLGGPARAVSVRPALRPTRSTSTR